MNFPDEYVIYDFETTGLETATCDVIEIGAMHVQEKGTSTFIDKKTWLIKIGYPLPEKITEITGITDSLLASEGIGEEEAFRAFADFAKGKVLMGHNILRYDNPILFRKAVKHGHLESFEYGMQNCIDTAGMFKAHILGRKHLTIQEFWTRVLNETIHGKFNLGHAFEVLGGDKTGIVAHRAGGDIEMVRAVYEKLKK